MKQMAATAFVLGSLLVAAFGASGRTAPREEPRAIVVGTFDSRALVFAHVGSEAFQEYLSAQIADLSRAIDRARAAGDRHLVAELEALGPAMQRRTHESGFGTAPVDDLVALLEDELAEIAREAGVDVIVSKWSLAYRAESAQFVDVTDQLVARFDPSEKTLAGIRAILAQDPVPLDELKEDH